ncbi:tyrosine phosphatase family protein [Bradyrhizobium sp. BRP14]|nr:tyrosine phosphatase family protein [Bradyrhizobium sp. BRP14]
MPVIVVSPLARIAEMAVRHGCREMLSLVAKGQDFHRPAVIDQTKHLTIGVNDISFAGTGDLVAPQEEHVERIIDFARNWDRGRPLLIHCWMGVSRSPAAALIAALAVEPDQDDEYLARRLRLASPFATPNARLVEIGDQALSRNGRLAAAVRSIGRGADADGNAPFALPLRPEKASHVGC